MNHKYIWVFLAGLYIIDVLIVIILILNQLEG